ncbi:putative peroxin 20 [Phaeomoniella chlamydospora]|uniref:Putative peroxin 20 n=1 Tax=Phaeomoniella chlamydospora TaxID=158046 RepID=A0A0G2GQV9_PHACM|nr:putative peroxin 20 [Phaeomoniella chlamydospora]
MADAVYADFAAFEAGQSFQPHAGAPPVFPEFTHPRHGSPLPSQSSIAAGPSWVNDFEKLRIARTNQPIPQSQFRTEAPLIRSQPGPAGWHSEFMKQQQVRQSPSLATSSQSYSAPQYGFDNSIAMPLDGFTQNQYVPQEELQNAQQQLNQPESVMDDAAFEEAFAQAESEHLNEMYRNAGAVEEMLEHKSKEVVEAMDTSEQDQVNMSDQTPIGSDLILERPEPTNETQQRAEADELARTAGDLLNALKHEQSGKFQQSQFLSLMRRIRDREVEVQGDDLKQPLSFNKTEHDLQNTTQPLHPGGQYYPEQSPPPQFTSIALDQESSMSGAITSENNIDTQIKNSIVEQFESTSEESPMLASRFTPRYHFNSGYNTRTTSPVRIGSGRNTRNSSPNRTGGGAGVGQERQSTA